MLVSWGKEPELVREVERYRLDLVGLASMALDRGWTLFFSRVAKGVRRRTVLWGYPQVPG